MDRSIKAKWLVSSVRSDHVGMCNDIPFAGGASAGGGVILNGVQSAGLCCGDRLESNLRTRAAIVENPTKSGVRGIPKQNKPVYRKIASFLGPV